MLGSATATLVMNCLLTNHFNSSNHHDKKELPKTKTTEHKIDNGRYENVIRSQANSISILQQDNGALKSQLEAVSDYLETCEAEVLKIEQQLETVLRSSKPNIQHDHDEPSRPQEVKEDWYSMSISLATENDELLAEQDKLANDFNATKEAYQVVLDQNTELRKIIEKKDADFDKRLDEAAKTSAHKIQEMQTKLDQAPKLATVKGNSVPKAHKGKEATSRSRKKK